MSCQIAKTEYWKIMIWLSDTKCCHLAIHYVLPKDRPGPNLHFRFMKNCIHTSLLGSLILHYVSFWKWLSLLYHELKLPFSLKRLKFWFMKFLIILKIPNRRNYLYWLTLSRPCPTTKKKVVDTWLHFLENGCCITFSSGTIWGLIYHMNALKVR